MKKKKRILTDQSRFLFITAFAALAVLAAVIAGIRFFSKDTLESAINEFEQQDYVDSLKMLNHLVQVTTDYDAAEKVYYYRCRALNALAVKIEKKYDDELVEAALDKKATPEYLRAEKKIREYLDKTNRKTGGDLAFMPARKKSRIIPRGKFYEEFVNRYKGSSLIEDLDFEELQKIERSEPDRLIGPMLAFYAKYPNTGYISQLARMVFDSLQNGTLKGMDRQDVLWDIIISYIKRYPTSPETGKLFSSKADNVNLRNSPGLEGKLVGKIRKDDILIQLEKSMDTYQVGDTRDYWYRVASLSGPTGWIFGKFLSPVDVSAYQTKEEPEKWTVEEFFEEWSDSNTPRNWSHIKGADRAAVNFSALGKSKVISADSTKEGVSGLYNRYNASRAFAALIRARFTGGDSIVAFGYSIGTGRSFYIRLSKDSVETSGRRIPLDASNWHEYMLKSEDGRYATLYIDGQMNTVKIEPVPVADFTNRGVYCLYSPKGEAGKGEIAYIKIR